MKTLFVIVSICVATVLCQTTEVPSFTQCFTIKLPEFSGRNSVCYGQLVEAFKWGTSERITTEDLTSFCASGCSSTVNTFFEAECRLPVSAIACTKDDNGNFCIEDSLDSIVGMRLAEINSGVCNNTNCSDAACNSAIESLTCCVTPLEDFNIRVRGGPFSLIPFNCTRSVCPEAVFGGVPPLVAVPSAVLMGLVAIFVAIL